MSEVTGPEIGLKNRRCNVDSGVKEKNLWDG